MGRTSEEGGLAWKGTPPPTPGKARCPRAWRNDGGEREREREGDSEPERRQAGRTAGLADRRADGRLGARTGGLAD